MTRKKKFEHRIFSDKDGVRFATPEDVAIYRAKRLRCKTIADISCGIGGQTIYFARECEHVYAVEIDPQKIAYARKNCKHLGITNVEFICADALSPEVIASLPQLDIVFSDPARPASEKVRDISNLQPSIPDVMTAYSTKTSCFAFEAPPQLTPERVPFDCEKEYLSLEGKMNRLNLYFGTLKKCGVSAIALPSGTRIESDDEIPDIRRTEEPALYAYEPEESVERAGLLAQLAEEVREQASDVSLFPIDKKRIFLTSMEQIDHQLFKKKYKVLNMLAFDIPQINEYLRENGFGTMLLRASVDPKEYWDIRNRLEKGLRGDRKAHLFLKGEIAILCETL
ncbi:methyltransferase domain-containing protein [Methanolobus halotolerans]|uniref:Methyltransferase n=1 Tax=Methanolobus halotolerans TaxID=2052935 RepID=A0A4E0Q7C7_9EURY|nr:methyltransferase domain-containing protein [Methanolobus halotolerans]TGC10880.1 methyltransferase [Methanolobus halotolerans]